MSWRRWKAEFHWDESGQTHVRFDDPERRRWRMVRVVWGHWVTMSVVGAGYVSMYGFLREDGKHREKERDGGSQRLLQRIGRRVCS
jgi:hypothetical protein